MDGDARIRLVALGLAFWILAAAGPAAAQPGNWQSAPAPVVVTPQPPPQHKRSGLIIGLSAGGAIGDEAKAQTGALTSFFVGGFLNPNLALMFQVIGFAADSLSYCADCTGQAEVAEELTVVGGSMQRWLSDRWWVRGTIGIGSGYVPAFGDLDGLGWGLGTGVDVLSGESFALDVRFDLMGAAFDEGSSTRAGLGLGLSWR